MRDQLKHVPSDPVDRISRICDDAEGDKLTRIAAVLGPSQVLTAGCPTTPQEPLFWYRPVGDGLYEGPHHHNSTEGRRLRAAKPGEWQPLYDHAAAPAQPLAAPEESHGMPFTHALSLAMAGFAGNPHPTTQNARVVIEMVAREYPRTYEVLYGTAPNGGSN